jgi:hypothetical protein
VTTVTTTTKRDAVDAALTLAQDIADGKLSPTELEAQAIEELRELVGDVVGPGDPLLGLAARCGARRAGGVGHPRRRAG